MTHYQRVAVDTVVERCFMTKGPICGPESEKQYVPLTLEVLGRQLRLPLNDSIADLTKWVNDLDLKWSNQKRHPIFSILRLNNDNLPSSMHNKVLFDVVLCVPRQQDNTSASLNELKDLQADGLVERWQDLASLVAMHELYCEFVKSEVTEEDNLRSETIFIMKMECQL